jgi:hypothetical protein
VGRYFAREWVELMLDVVYTLTLVFLSLNMGQQIRRLLYLQAQTEEMNRERH